MPSTDRSSACRVCGLLQATPPWGDSGADPTFEICDCCGVEFGYQDTTPAAARAYRARWEERGRAWWRPKERPRDWRWEDQARNIPDPYR